MNEMIITHTLNEKQFAKAVGLSYAKVKQMRQQGFIKHSKVGRRILYKFPEHIEMFLSNFEQAG
jgi:predicted transcriptional regulator